MYDQTQFWYWLTNLKSSFGIDISYLTYCCENQNNNYNFSHKDIASFKFLVPISFTFGIKSSPKPKAWFRPNSNVKNDETSFGIRGPFQSVSVSDFWCVSSSQCTCKVIYPKYYKYWLYTLAYFEPQSSF